MSQFGIECNEIFYNYSSLFSIYKIKNERKGKFER